MLVLICYIFYRTPVPGAAVPVFNTTDDGRLTPEKCRVTLQKWNLHSVASIWCFIWPRGIALHFLGSRHTRWRVRGQPHAPAASTPGERPGTHSIGGWVDTRAGLDGRKILSPPGFDPGSSSPVAQSLYRLSYPIERKAWLEITCQEVRVQVPSSKHHQTQNAKIFWISRTT